MEAISPGARRFTLALFLVCLVAVVGCQGEAPETEKAVAALGGNNQTQFQVTLSLPAFGRAADTVMAANGTLEVGDHAVVVKTPTTPAVLVNTGGGGTAIDSAARVNSVQSTSQVVVGLSATVDGDVLTTVPVVLQPHATVTGVINQNAVFTPNKTVTWTVNFPATSQGNVIVGPPRTLTPDRYSEVTVLPGNTLTLRSGVYYLDELELQLLSKLKLDQSQGPVIVYVRSEIGFHGTVTSLDGSPPQLLVVYLGTQTALVDVSFNGTWISPSAELVLASSLADYRGTFFAKDIELFPRVTVRQVRLTGDFDHDGLTTQDEIDTYGTNPFVADTDGDGLNDGAEVTYWSSRTDGISWNSDVDVIGSHEFTTTKGDGLINVLDPDSDNDGILDGAEVAGWDMPTPGGPAVHVDSDPAFHDTDGDGMNDKAERDGSSLTVKGVSRHVVSHPRMADTDGDGLDDFAEVTKVFSDPQNTHTFGPFYPDQDRAKNLAVAGPSVLDPPCQLYTNNQSENVFVTSYTLQFTLTTSTLNLRSVRQLYAPDTKAGVPFTVHFRSELASDPTNVDTNDTFSSVQVKRPDTASFELLSAGPNAGEYTAHITPTTAQTFGFYDFQLQYLLDNNSSKYHFFATFDDDGQPVPLAWTDPDFGAHVDVGFRTDGTAPVYLRGGAYGDGSDAAESRVTNIFFDSQKLYESAFNGADFNYPLGAAAAGDHTLSFDWITSATSSTKLMTHICQFGVPWNDVQITYMSNAHTRDYSSWKTGVATTTAVVRRDTTFTVVGHGASLANGDGSVQIYKGGVLQSGWSTSKHEDYDARDGHFQHWHVTVPANAAIGEYSLRMLDNLSVPVGTDAPFRVIFNPYRLVNSTFTKSQLETYAYDEDEDGDEFGADSDHGRDDWTAFHLGATSSRSYQLHSFKARTGQANVLDLAVAATDGATDEFEAATRIFRLMNQRIHWSATTTYLGQDVDDLLGTDGGLVTALAPSDAQTFSGNDQDLFAAFPAKRMEGECMDFGAGLIGLARSLGIPAKHSATPAAFSWSGFHAWSEVYLPSSLLPRQEGKTMSGGGTDSDTDNWYVFDSTDNFSTGGWPHSEESIDPRVDFYSSFVSNGATVPTHIFTSRVDWCPPGLGTCTTQADDILTSYSTPTDFWITGSSVHSWLSGGDKDLFKVNLTSQATVSVTPTTDLDIVTCAYNFTPTTANPFTECADESATRVLQPGLWTIQVFSRSAHDGVHGGNYVHYTLSVL